MKKDSGGNGTNNSNRANVDTEICQICGGLGVVTMDVPVGHPDFGKAFPCVCQAANVKSRKAQQLRTLSNLDIYADKTFSTFQIDFDLLDQDSDFRIREVFSNGLQRRNLTENQRRIVNTAAEIALHYADEPDGWLLLQGTYGTGKSHLALAIANHRLEQNQPVLFITTPDLLDYLRATFGPSSEVAYDERFDQLRTAPLLILDDLGAESQTAWAQEKLYQLMNYRHTRKLPTILTTNVAPEMMEARIRSRLLDQELTRSISLSIPDRRSPASTWEEADLSNLDRYRTMTFDTFDLRQDEGIAAPQLQRLERTVQVARYFAESPRGWLVFTGEPGCGKTHLAAAIAHECRNRGETIVFVTAGDLLDHLRVTFYPGSQVSYDKRLNEIRQAYVLILDNLSIDRNLSSWARDKLLEILTYRFDAEMPTIITSIQALKDMDDRLKSRVANISRSVVEAITVPYYPGKQSRRAIPPKMKQK